MLNFQSISSIRLGVETECTSGKFLLSLLNRLNAAKLTPVQNLGITPYLLKTEAASTTSTTKTLAQLIDEMQTHQILIDSVHWEDGNKIRDGILKRAHEEMISLAKQWTVQPDELEAKTREMINASVYFTAAAQQPPKSVYTTLSHSPLFNAPFPILS